MCASVEARGTHECGGKGVFFFFVWEEEKEEGTD